MVVELHIPDPNDSNRELAYSIDRKMQKFLDKIKNKINVKDKDYVMLIDGYEGSGKSTAAQQWGKYVDNTLDIDRICMTADEFKDAIYKAGKGQCVIYDEAVTGLTSGDSISRIGKLLKSLMMQMRQNNLFVIIILPTIFELNKYAVLSRARSFFHIYENHGKMGYFVGYNRKDTRLLYLRGKKNYAYKVKSRFIGRFYGKYVINEEQYRAKKKAALELMEGEGDKPTLGKSVWKNQRDILLWALNKKGDKRMTMKEIEYMFKSNNCMLNQSEMSDIIREVDGKISGKVSVNADNITISPPNI